MTKGRFPINQVYVKQLSSFINKKCLSKINRNQPFCKRYITPTSLGNIMEPRTGFISYTFKSVYIKYVYINMIIYICIIYKI